MTDLSMAVLGAVLCIAGCTTGTQHIHESTQDVDASTAKPVNIPLQDLQGLYTPRDASEPATMPDATQMPVETPSDASNVQDAEIEASDSTIAAEDAAPAIEDRSCMATYGAQHLRLCGQMDAVACIPSTADLQCLESYLMVGTYLVHNTELVSTAAEPGTCTLVARTGYCHIYADGEPINVPGYYRETVVNVLPLSESGQCPVAC